MCIHPHAAQPHSVPVLSGSHLLGYSGCEGAGSVSAGPSADPQAAWLLPGALLSCAGAQQLPEERICHNAQSSKCTYCDWEFHWSHPIKLYRELNLIALSTLGQYT